MTPALGGRLDFHRLWAQIREESRSEDIFCEYGVLCVEIIVTEVQTSFTLKS